MDYAKPLAKALNTEHNEIIEDADAFELYFDDADSSAELSADELTGEDSPELLAAVKAREAALEAEEEAEPAPAVALAAVDIVVERGIKALVSDDPQFARSIANDLAFDFDKATNEYTLQWPRVDNGPSDFIRIAGKKSAYEVVFSTTPSFHGQGVTANYDESAKEGSTPQALGTLQTTNDAVLSTLVARLIRHVHNKRETEALLGTGLVKSIATNTRQLLRDVPRIPLKNISDHEHGKAICAHFWPVSDRSTSTHMGIVVAKPADGILVLNSAVRASYLVHRLNPAQTADVKVGDALSINYGIDKRLGDLAKIGRPSLDAVAEKIEAVQLLKQGRPLSARRELVFAAASDTRLPAFAEIALDARKVVEKPAQAPVRKRGIENRGR